MAEPTKPEPGKADNATSPAVTPPAQPVAAEQVKTDAAARKKKRLQRLAMLLPVGLVLAAVAANSVGLTPTSRDNSEAAEEAPVSIPTSDVEDPASISNGGTATMGDPANAQQIVDTTAAAGIPPLALSAYQRAETVINSSDPTCKLQWQLIAGIARIESDHGRYNNNVLDADGRARPGIYGIPLDGTNNTKNIGDTDGGEYDKSKTTDRAVGPLQFIPSTWAMVGVDGDNDGVREPQDIDDASLAAAVYLCSGDDDLSTDEGRRAAVYRYNNSDEYVDVVLKIYDQYLAGNFQATPTFNTGTVHSPTQIGNTPQIPSYPTNNTPYSPGPNQPGNYGKPPKTPKPKPTKKPTLPSPSVSTLGQPLTYAEARKQCLKSNPGLAQDQTALLTCVNDLLAG